MIAARFSKERAVKKLTYLVAICATPVLLTSCTGDGPLGITDCPHDFRTVFDANYDGAEVDALLEATARLSVAAAEMEADTLGACNAIAADLGAETSTDVEIACMNASVAIDAIFAANSSATIVIDVVPARCSIDIDASATCAAECDASFDATATPPTCTGGEVTGTCSADCTGSCTVEGMVDCSATCNGTCMGTCDARVEGTCTGVCAGRCEGTCAMEDGDGNCMGECTGTCRGQCMGDIEGTCTGSCAGSCMGSCTSDVMATCDGRCTGMCSVEFMEPRCEGGEVDVQASAECKAACETELAAEAECTEPQIIVLFTGAADAVEMIDALAATLSENLPRLLNVLDKAAVVAEAGIQIANNLTSAAGSALEAGLEASACMTVAVDIQIEASASVTSSADGSATVAASATADTPGVGP